MGVNGCLPFTWANQLVHGVVKWFAKFRTGKFRPLNRVYHQYHWNKSVPFTEKRPRRPETGIKDGFEEMEHEFPFGIFHPEKQDYLLRRSVDLGNFPSENTQKVVFHLLSNRISRKITR